MSRSENSAALAATATALVMIGQQVAGKAVRDAVFLTHYDITSLPGMIIGAAMVAVVAALGTSRLMSRFSPARVVPVGFGVSAVMLLGEWIVLGIAPRVAAALLFLHMAAMGGVLISGFWSLVNERFDPHTAKKYVGRITFGASVGGLVGGLIAERVSALFGIDFMLPVMAGMHAICAWTVLAVRPAGPVVAPEVSATPEPATETSSGFEVLSRLPYLRNLALLALIGALASGLADYVFKAQADAAFPDGDALGRFFAGYYTAISLLTLLAQGLLARHALERLGLARTVTTHPASVIAAGVGAVLLPGLVTATIMRGADAVLRNSLFRAGYELLFTPVSRDDKRATKTIIDVGIDKIGDAIGAGLVAVLLVAGPASSQPLMVAAAMALAGVAVWVSLRLHRGYVRALENSLVTQAEHLDLDDIKDSTTRLSVLETLGVSDLKDIRQAAMELRTRMQAAAAAEADPQSSGGASSPTTSSATAQSTSSDPVVAQIMALRSRDAGRIRAALQAPGGLRFEAAAHAVDLLAWDEVQRDVVRALRPLAPRITGQLIDVLLDPDADFAIRRRVPRVLGAGDPPRAIEGLLAGLSDRRFEVRFQCGRAVSLLHTVNPGVDISKRRVLDAVSRALDVSQRVWDGQVLLDAVDAEGSLLDDVLEERANRSLEHVFTLMALTLPRRPVKIALKGLHTDDPQLRGTALEYLETALPREIYDKLRPYAAGDGSHATPAPTDGADAAERLERLLESRQSIEVNLADLRQRVASLKQDES